MQTTLISGLQGSGKTQLVSAITGIDNFLLFGDYIESSRRLTLVQKEAQSTDKCLIFDDVYSCDDIHRLIDQCEAVGVDLILISNEDHTNFHEFDIDFYFGVEYLNKLLINKIKKY